MNDGNDTTTIRKLTIAHVDSEIGYSGGEVQVFLLMQGLNQLGYRNLLCCPPNSRCQEEATRTGIECIPVRMRNDLDARAVVALRNAFRRHSVDIVHLHTGRATWLGGLAARMCGIPAVTTRRMDKPIKKNWRSQLIYTRLVHKVVAISNGVADRLLAGGVPQERIKVIYSAVEPSHLRPLVGREATRTTLGVSQETLVLLTLAALVFRKGLDVLLTALSLLAAEGIRPCLWIAGDGPERPALETLAERLGLAHQVRFLGKRNDIGDLLAACDVFVIPSRREGLGVSALEALAAGRPVVGSSVGGIKDAVVDGRTGILVPPDEPTALAHALLRILKDEVLREQLGSAGPERISQGFLATQMVASYEQLYRSLLEELPMRSAQLHNFF